ncbi:hypothetical protein [Nocardioides sp. SYSU D00065]|uniref:hypothetical protein n=1 Tax=Nocardioides sp. SYSU D00065 TaxID=2817378 RepID=UPI001B32AD63|nr:hypothetical protein [Nocardioides sp. SYSU D00065]
MIHPWRLLHEAEHVLLDWHDGGPMGRAHYATDTISLRRGMSWAPRRCTVVHELLHLRRGVPAHGWTAQDEQRVRRDSARMLLPDIHTIGEALAWALDEHEAADELGVDVPTLTNRLQHLHPSERGYLKMRLEKVG